MKKLLFPAIIVSSLVFAVYYLHEKSLLNLNSIVWGKDIYFSLIFLFAGFLASTLSWWYALKVHNINISVKSAITSHGLSVFAKYIPGKIWTVLGRASKISIETDVSVGVTSFISLKEQLVYLLTGIFVSIIPVYLTYGFSLFFVFVLLSGVGLALIIFNKIIHKLLIKILNKFLKKEIELPLLSIKEGLKLSLFNFILWFFWAGAFYFFGKSFDTEFTFSLAFVFPVSVVYGVLAIILPGGIGVREGIISAYLSMSGLNLELATTISVVSRLWFFFGEVFIFLTSVLVNLFKTK